MLIINSNSCRIRLREGTLAGTILEPGESRDVGGLAEQIGRPLGRGESAGGGALGTPGPSVVERWNVPGLLVEGDARFEEYVRAQLSGLRANANAELEAAGVAGSAVADRDGLRFRVTLPAGADLASVEAKVREASGFGPTALEVVG